MSTPACGRWSLFWHRRHTRKALLSLTHEQLRDIGLSAEQARALDVLGLADDADRRALRERYAALVRRFHPDRNGGDRSQEARLQAVVEAYEVLRRAPGFA